MARQRTVPARSTGAPLGTLSIEVLSGPDAGLRYVAQKDNISIGTADGNDVVLKDETVSRYHAELTLQGDRILVEDHGSTNGTLHGQASLKSATISAGSVLALGHTQLRVDPGATRSVELYGSEQLGEVVARSPVMRRLFAQMARAAESNVPILINGETGTGKEVTAHTVHELSPRRSGPFETVDCGSLMPTLIASELFGHEKGSFTGADRTHIGAFERANGGTLFLDEIGELPSALQPALLGALERRSFRRVGGQKAINVDVRVLCATHRDLRAEVNAGRFRQDLYYRIAVLALRIPPLRERAEDIPPLIEHFLKASGYTGDPKAIIPDAALAGLIEHQWPGNVRELRNFVDAARALGEAPSLAHGDGAPASNGRALDFSGLWDEPYGDAKTKLLAAFEGQYLQRLMESTEGKVTEAARKAKMNRSHLLELVKRHGLK